MNDYIEGFARLGLISQTPANYRDAREYAKNFQKASVLINTNVKYSSNASGLIKSQTPVTISCR